MPAPASSHSPPFTELGQYQLIRKLGAGAMGAVYLARHTNLDKMVAVKLLAADRMSDPKAVDRFRREMKAVGQLDHPQIVRATDAGFQQGQHFLVMEYVDGVDLSALVRRVGPLRIADACEIARQAADGLQHAHERGLVHRDFKPSNLMLTSRRVVKVLDFGLARLRLDDASSDGLTGSGQIVGTLAFMAPEQFDDSHEVDIRADLYSLGCTLFFLLTGQPPYSGPKHRSLFEIMTGHKAGPIPDARQARSEVPPELAALVTQLLSKSPDQRFAEPAEVSARLSAWSTGHQLDELCESARSEERPASGTSLPDHQSSSPSAAEFETTKLFASPGRDSAEGDGAARRRPASPVGTTRPSSAAPDSQESVPESEPIRAKSDRIRFVRWRRAMSVIALLLLVGSAALLAIYGFPPREGTLVVLSESDGALVDVRRNGERVRSSWRLNRGENQWSLAAGEVTVHLSKEQPPRFVVQQEATALTRGEQIVARVRLVPAREKPVEAAARAEGVPRTPATDSPDEAMSSAEPLVAPFSRNRAKSAQAAWSKSLELPPLAENSAGMRFVLIPPGSFDMGSSEQDVADFLKDLTSRSLEVSREKRELVESEAPRHRVQISKPFLMCAHEVNQKEYLTVAGTNSASFRAGGTRAEEVAGLDSEKLPVDVSDWYEVIRFCNTLSRREGLTPCYQESIQGTLPGLIDGTGYRLPTEAEWEYACRAGTVGPYSFDAESRREYVAENSIGRAPSPVAERLPNPFGLYDMHGNLCEWCIDQYDSQAYRRLRPPRPAPGASHVDPVVLDRSGTILISVRGGSIRPPFMDSRSAARYFVGFNSSTGSVGLRLVRSAIPTGLRAVSEDVAPAVTKPPVVKPLDSAPATPVDERREALAKYLRAVGTPAVSAAAADLSRMRWPVDRLSPTGVPEWFAPFLQDGGDSIRDSLVATWGDPRWHHGESVAAVAFSPDGRLLLSGGADRAIRIWNSSDGRLLTVLDDHPASVEGLSVAGNDRVIAACTTGWLGSISLSIWKAPSWDETQRAERWQRLGVIEDLPEQFASLACSRDGRRAAVGTRDGRVAVCDLDERKIEFTQPLRDQKAAQVAFTADGRQLVVAGDQGRVEVWKIPGGELVRTVTVHTKGVTAVAAGPAGRFVATSGYDRRLKIWSLPEWEVAADLPDDSYASSLCFSADENALFEGGAFDNSRWLERQGESWKGRLAAGTSTRSVAINASGNLVAIAEWYGMVRLWRPGAAAPREESPLHEGLVSSVAVAPDGTGIFSGGRHGELRHWSLVSPGVSRAYEQQRRSVGQVAVQPDGTRVAIVGDELIGLDVRYTESGKADFHSRQAGEAVSFSADGRWLAAARCSNDPGEGSLLVWKLGESEPLPTTGKAIRVGAVSLSPTGTWVAAASQWGGPKIRVWNAATGAELQTIYYPSLSRDRNEPYSWVTSISYSPDGRTLAAGGLGEVALWTTDPATGLLQEPARILKGHAPHVWSVHFSPDGSRLVAAGNDGTVRICRLPDGQVASTLLLGRRHDVIRQAVFAPDGRHIVTANGHGTICILRCPAATDGQ